MTPLFLSRNLYHPVKILHDFYHGVWPDIKLYHILIIRNELYHPSQSMSHQSYSFCDEQLEMNAVQAAVLAFQTAAQHPLNVYTDK